MKKISDNEKSVLVAIVENAKSVGDTGVEFFFLKMLQNKQANQSIVFQQQQVVLPIRDC